MNYFRGLPPSLAGVLWGSSSPCWRAVRTASRLPNQLGSVAYVDKGFRSRLWVYVLVGIAHALMFFALSFVPFPRPNHAFGARLLACMFIGISALLACVIPFRSRRLTLIEDQATIECLQFGHVFVTRTEPVKKCWIRIDEEPNGRFSASLSSEDFLLPHRERLQFGLAVSSTYQGVVVDCRQIFGDRADKLIERGESISF